MIAPEIIVVAVSGAALFGAGVGIGAVLTSMVLVRSMHEDMEPENESERSEE